MIARVKTAGYVASMRSSYRNLALVLGSISLAVLTFEGLFRLIVDYDANESDRMRFDRRLGWVMESKDAAADHVNSKGFRFLDVDFDKPTGTRRLVILGDSFAQAARLPFAMTFPGILQEHLNGGAAKWDVINLAVGGWGTYQQLLALESIGLQYQPDVILLQVFAYNDYCNNSVELAFACSPLDFHRPYYEQTADGWTTRYATNGAPFRISQTYRFLENRIAARFGRLRGLGAGTDRRQFFLDSAIRLGMPDAGRNTTYALIQEKGQPEVMRQAWQTSKSLIREASVLAKRNSIPLVAFVIPHEPTLPHEWDSFSRRTGSLDVSPSYATDRFETFLSAEEVPVIKVRDRIRQEWIASDDYYSPDGCTYDRHLGRIGQYAAANWTLELLDDLGLTDTPALSLHFSGGDILGPAPLPIRRLGFCKGKIGVGSAPAEDHAGLAFYVVEAEEYQLNLGVRRASAMTIMLNGAEVGTFTSRGRRIGLQTRLRLAPGRNEIAFIAEPLDPSQRRIVFDEIVLQPAPSISGKSQSVLRHNSPSLGNL